MNPLKYIWTNPYPEAVLWPVTQLFRRLSSHMEKRPISDRRYRIQCFVISAASFIALFLITGIGNPLEFFVDIPIYDLSEFNVLVDGDEYALFTYAIGSAIVVVVAIYLIRLFLFNGKEFSFFSVNGICFEIMVVFVTALLDIPIRKMAYIYAKTLLPSIEGKGEVGTVILLVLLNFALYFVIQDSFSAILSSALALEFIMFFQDRLLFTSNRLLLLLVVTVIVRLILELLDMGGLWEKFVSFCSKWFYTLEYMIKWMLWFITIIMWLMSRGCGVKKGDSDRNG